jgi:PAS domain S-box-containing protein
METKIELLERRIIREQKARKEAERILEEKAIELYNTNLELKKLNETLQNEVNARTKALERSRQRYMKLVESATEIIYEADSKGQITYVNPITSKLLLYTHEELIGKHYLELVPASHINIVENFYNDCLAKKEYQTYFEFPILRKDKTILWIGQNLQFNITSREVIIGLRAIARNITDKHFAQLQLQLSEEKYRRIMENMELGFLEVDLNGNIVRAYERFCEMMGYEESDLIGKNAIETFLPKEFEELMKQQEENRAIGKTNSYEIQLRRKNGDLMWVLISGGPIFDEKGETIGSVGIHYDISQQKKILHELAKAKQLAEASEKAEQEFLANMSHEIRTPLNAIIGMSHLLYDTSPSKEQIEYVEIIKNSANFLHTLISDVLDMAKIEARKIEVKPRAFDLVSLLRTIQRTFQLKIQERNVNIITTIDKKIDCQVVADETLLNQILLNLMSNSEKFTEKGEIELKVEVHEINGKSGQLKFSVRDTGIGMDDEKQKLIFQKFKQIHDKNTPKTKGTGLGLAIVKELIELQGGKIWVESKRNLGTTFTFMLPVSCTSTKLVDIFTNPLPVAKASFDGCRILVVEDNYMNRKFVSTLLSKWNIEQEHAHNGLEAVEMANKQAFDIILMDIQMPIMDGYEACIKIRNSNNPNQKAVIIALTASAMIVEKSKAIASGMNDVLTKPFTPILLEEMIRKFVTQNEDHSPALQTHQTPKISYEMNLNQEKIYEIYGDDNSFKLSVFEAFLEDIDSQVKEFDAAIEDKNWQEVGKIAHKIKPSFAMVGLPETEQLLKEIETTLKQSDLTTQVIEKINDFKLAFPRLLNLVIDELNVLRK